MPWRSGLPFRSASRPAAQHDLTAIPAIHDDVAVLREQTYKRLDLIGRKGAADLALAECRIGQDKLLDIAPIEKSDGVTQREIGKSHHVAVPANGVPKHVSR